MKKSKSSVDLLTPTCGLNCISSAEVYPENLAKVLELIISPNRRPFELSAFNQVILSVWSTGIPEIPVNELLPNRDIS